ncbi:MAG TPA: efflux RND transporter permease subunit [Candidatus Dormibacteraeota bacterium]|nr:efflux RND transporter permease subunit [Candidatus Dormibacteraeota bacterium]
MLKRKIIVGLFVSFILVFGLYSFLKMDQELFPKIDFDQSMVLIETENMPATDVEKMVTQPVEKALDGMEGVESYESSSTIGNSTFFIMMEQDKGEEITKEIENTISGMQDQLHGVKDTYVMQVSTDQPYEFNMDVSGKDLQEMSDFSLNVLKPRLESLPEVREVALAGLEEKEIIVHLQNDKLNELGIGQEDILHSIQQMNVNESIGEFESDKNDLSIRWNTNLETIEDIKDIQIQTSEGLKSITDIADVKEETTEQPQLAWKNGNSDFILVQIGRTVDATQIDMAEAVRAEVEKIEQEGLPGNLKLEEIAAQADYVSNAIDGVSGNILIGGLIAIVVLMLFLRNTRATFIVTLSIPSSILLTILTMNFMDISFNLASLIGLGLGIGMMVDASIVVLESIYKKKEQGFPNVKAVIEGTKEVATAVISSMLTTIVVFLPIAILENDIGKVVFTLAVVVAITLISSMLISFTLIPVMSENFLKLKKRKQKKISRVKRTGIIDRYGNILRWLTKKKRRRIGVISLFIVLFISSFFLLVKVPMSVMPDIFDRYSELMIDLDSGVTPSERAEIADEINKKLDTVQDVETNIVIDNVESLIAIINMTPEEEKTVEQTEVNENIMRQLRKLEEDYPISSIGTTTEGMSSFPIQVEVSGNDYDTLRTLGNDLAEELEEIEGVVFAKSEANELEEEMSIELNYNQLEKDGLTARAIYQQMNGLFAKVPVGDILKDQETTPIFLENDVSISDKDELLTYEIMTPNGNEKLSKYVSLKNVSAPTQIDRKNGTRYISVVADIEGRDLGSINRDVQNLIEDFDTEDGYSVGVSGDLEQQQEAATDLLVIFGISLFLVFVVMTIQFNSLKHPLIILSIIPLTVTGVFVGLFLTQKDLNVMSGIGVIMLVGIVLNNGILLIDRVKQQRNQGINVDDAIVDAGKDRIRPIFMTTLTTVGGMIPLAFATGASSGYQSPLAVVIISGLLFSTFITLILIPSIYLVFEDIGRGLKRLFTRKRNKKIENSEEIRA